MRGIHLRIEKRRTIANSSGKRVFVCAGMYRSGSTWLYNAVRLILTRANAPGLAAGWIADKAALLDHQNSVIKIHSYDPELVSPRNLVLTSHRDLRDVAASLCRKFNKPFDINVLQETVESHSRWARLAVYDLKYENLLHDKLAELRAIAAVLRLDPATLSQLPFDSILEELEGEKFSNERSTPQGHDAVNLLHPGHVTDGRHGSWGDVLADDSVQAIEKAFRPWLAKRGYIPPKASSLLQLINNISTGRKASEMGRLNHGAAR